MQQENDQESLYQLQSYMFDLPSRLIAQYPAEPRDSARMLVVNRETGELQDRVFTNLLDYLEEGDTLVLNDTRVIPARLFARKDTGARIEVFLLKPGEDGWEALVKPARRMKPGTIIEFENSDQVQARVMEELDFAGGRLIKFLNCPDINAFINQSGAMPLPPYINRPAREHDKEDYQTVYARYAGSVAAPTAGLHFTDALLDTIKNKGINIAYVLLHVGLGTFRPVSTDDIRRHEMHYEYYQINEKTADLLNQTRQSGHKIIAVGTTVVRTLETVYNVEHGFSAMTGQTNKFIYPGYQFKAIDSLITNFHLPGSSLVMLVAALAGFDFTMKAYRYAVENEYRFFSYGDAMLIV
ncbi:MAG TPA: tRNA preQ1(34) S-adenosylmethionine ribosyltransferase-isomerase QueA [Syntrophomonas sp.]|jgi:S-adenosylmethionine:tRNA ribosyltransferase-isomerase|nr:tRNA preQ1(34) S-adenosylmethionine ribosyltransferase-isomerase QueA [Syntrophomonas sp.]HCF71081.1 tRNA preQ1(34) S-adenosylmethionine ribosyltransferase-isomerase QueA [Syntrophomonas sp.]